MMARDWPEVPCKIISAEYKMRHDWSAEIIIVYQYEFEGKAYESSRYSFNDPGKSGFVQEVVERYKKAANPVCFVDPENPSESVLNRALGHTIAGVLLGLFFLLGGLSLSVAQLKIILKSRKNK